MAQNGTEFKWDSKRAKAAHLVAEGRLTDEQIADRLSIGRRTLSRWKELPEFQGRVQEIATRAAKAIEEKGIVEKLNRLNSYDDRWQRMLQVIAERSVEYAHVPGGGKTGLLVRQTKSIGRGEQFQVIEEYAVDTGLLRELREIEKQAAVEMGQWTEKHEHGGALLNIDLSQLTNEQLDRFERYILAGYPQQRAFAMARQDGEGTAR